MRGKQKVNKASGRKFRTSPLILGDESDGVGESQVDKSFPCSLQLDKWEMSGVKVLVDWEVGKKEEEAEKRRIILVGVRH